jgi:hypothetical protein
MSVGDTFRIDDASGRSASAASISKRECAALDEPAA